MIPRLLRSILLFVFIPALAQSPSPRTALQQSLGFEDESGSALAGWRSYPSGSVSVDSDSSHSGRRAVRFERNSQSGSSFSVITRQLPIDFKGGTIELRGYLRLKDVSDHAGLWLRQDVDDHMLSLENMQSQQVKGTREWQQYRITVPVDPRAEHLYFGVLFSGTGTLWADDLELLVDGKPITEVPAAPPRPSLLNDHEFDAGSRVSLTGLSFIQIKNLVTLGRVWGFLKYHHPAITTGQRHWDYDLFRILPAILAAPDRAHANKVLVAWIDRIGPVPSCTPCLPVPSGELDLKPDLAWIQDRKMLGKSLSQRLESIYANRNGKQFYVSLTPGVGNPSFDHEPPYRQVNFPDAGYQILALFRWWNILQYWAPYRVTANQDWPSVLAEFIPKVALAKDRKAYELALLELITKANDTHANLWSSLAVRPPTGDCGVPIALRMIDDKVVVYRTSPDSPQFQTGDIVKSLDGVAVSSLIATVSRYYADSNEAARRRDLAANLTRGACGPVSVEIVRKDASPQGVSAQRVPFKVIASSHDQPGDTFRLLSPEVAYIKLSSIRAKNLPDYFERAKDTKGLIVDIRNYPSEFMPFAMGAYFATNPTSFASFTAADLSNPGTFRFRDGSRIRPGAVHYKEKIVILVDEVSQSQAEYTAMALRAMPNAMIVGSTTAGADGDVSAISLPGGLSTMISGLGIYYPDHRPTQRIGIVPDVVVEPTVQGIVEGRDEVLESAIRLAGR